MSFKMKKVGLNDKPEEKKINTSLISINIDEEIERFKHYKNSNSNVDIGDFDEKLRMKLFEEAFNLVKKVTEIIPQSPEADDFVVDLNAIGNQEIKRLSNSASSTSDKLIKENSGFSQASKDFNAIIEYLDPYKHGKKEEDKRGFWSRLADGSVWKSNKNAKEINIVERYVEVSEKLTSLKTALHNSKFNLTRANATMQVEREEMYEHFGKIEEKMYILNAFKMLLTRYIDPQDEKYKKYLQEKFLYEVNQKIMSITGSLGTNVNMYMTFEVQIKQNENLIKWVDKISTDFLPGLLTAIQMKSQDEFVKEATNFMKQVKTFTDENGNLLDPEKLIKIQEDLKEIDARSQNIQSIMKNELTEENIIKKLEVTRDNGNKKEENNEINQNKKMKI